MSTTLRPDNVKAALDAKLAAAMAQLAELREAEQPRLTTHLSSRELVGALLNYARSVPAIAGAFGKAQAGELQFDSWHDQWVKALSDADRAVWQQLNAAHGQGDSLVDVEIVVPRESSVAQLKPSPDTQAGARKRLARFAAYPARAASDVCRSFVWLAKRYADDFLRDHARFLH
jgi:hypothetical protein